jgi:hypothetical protein
MRLRLRRLRLRRRRLGLRCRLLLLGRLRRRRRFHRSAFGRALGAPLLVAATPRRAGGDQEGYERGRPQRSTAGSRRPQYGQSFRSFWTSCSSEHPHILRFSTA